MFKATLIIICTLHCGVALYAGAEKNSEEQGAAVSLTQSESFLKMAKEEEEPLVIDKSKHKLVEKNGMTKIGFLLAGVFFITLSIGGFLYHWLRKKQKNSGGRKYLIEQLAYFVSEFISNRTRFTAQSVHLLSQRNLIFLNNLDVIK